MSKHLFSALKLALACGLMYLVLASIHWQDGYVELDGEGVESAPIAGVIHGSWDGDVVRFVPTGGTEELSLRRDETRVAPGLLTYWRNVDAAWFVLGAFCYVLSVLFAAARWWWLLRVNDLQISFGSALRFTCIGLFFNNVVPGQTGGDLVKAIYVMKRCHGQRVPAMMSVVVDRILGLASLSLLAAFAILFYLDKGGFGPLAVALWGVLAGVAVLGMVAFSRRVRSLVRLKTLLEKLPDKLSHLLKRVDHAVFSYRSHKVGIAAWLCAGILNHVVSVLSYAFVGVALGVGIPIVDYFVLIPIIVIVSAIPIAPNGWGVGEFMFERLFGEFGASHLARTGVVEATRIMATRGVALSLLYRIHLTLWSLIGGVLFFFDRDKVTREEMAEQVAREEREEAELEAAGAVDIDPESAESTKGMG